MKPSGVEAVWQAKVADSGTALLSGLAALEVAFRRLHPPEIDGLREQIAPRLAALAESRDTLAAIEPPPDLADLHRHWSHVVTMAGRALEAFAEPAPPQAAAPRILQAMQLHARAQEALFPFRRVFPPISDFFFETAARPRAAELAPEPAPEKAGLQVAGDPEGRGGFHLYVPDSYDEAEPLPLVVALHGGFGHGRDFLWTWLREARSRRFLLLSPTSRDTTWALNGADLDGPALRSMIDWVAESWSLDRERILLTGLSDGATFTLLAGLAEDAPYTALAPVSGVLHPANISNGNLARARGKRIYLVHGTLDWMFPVALAREARDLLVKNGADVLFREVADLSHTYPREENGRILEWFDPRLALS
ncbi:MAG: phospholipase [Deltaproteobacteria bacterium]|nr:phospholipase [Deltaproteobacteria bacterium]MBW2447939.1 phospholipase [Deltaproteobacteria bacterium]